MASALRTWPRAIRRGSCCCTLGIFIRVTGLAAAGSCLVFVFVGRVLVGSALVGSAFVALLRRSFAVAALLRAGFGAVAVGCSGFLSVRARWRVCSAR